MLGRSPKQETASLASSGPAEAANDKARLMILKQPSAVAITGRSDAAHSMSVGFETKSLGDLSW